MAKRRKAGRMEDQFKGGVSNTAGVIPTVSPGLPGRPAVGKQDVKVPGVPQLPTQVQLGGGGGSRPERSSRSGGAQPLGLQSGVRVLGNGSGLAGRAKKPRKGK